MVKGGCIYKIDGMVCVKGVGSGSTVKRDPWVWLYLIKRLHGMHERGRLYIIKEMAWMRERGRLYLLKKWYL